jgi:Tfp pilus assembly protein PilO
LVYPQYQEYQNANQKISLLKNQLSAREDYFSTLNNLWKNLKAQPDFLKKIDNALPDKFEAEKLVYFLSKSSQENGLLLSDILITEPSAQQNEIPNQTSEGKEEPKPKEWRFSLNLIGNYASFENFIKQIEKSAKLLEIEKISVVSGGPETFKFRIDLLTYSY